MKKKQREREGREEEKDMGGASNDHGGLPSREKDHYILYI